MSIFAMAQRYHKSLAYMFRQKQIDGTIQKVYRGARYLSFIVRLKKPEDLTKALSITDNIALSSGAKEVIVRRVGGCLHYDFALAANYWKSYSLSDVSGWEIGIGTKPVELTLDEPNTIFVGSPGSGKTEALKAALLISCLNLSPDELKIVLIDPHNSIDEFDQSAHLMTAVARSQEEIATTIRVAHDEYTYRRELGERQCKTLPRLLLAIDEANETDVLGQHKSINTDNLNKVRDIVKGGRKFRVNVLLTTQKPTETDLPGIWGIVQNRYIGAVSSARIASHLGGQGGINAHLLTGKGDLMYVSPDGVIRFQCILPRQKDYKDLPKAKPPQIPTGEERIIGRPKTELNPEILAIYLTDDVSISQASKMGIGRKLHKRYKEFAMRVKEVWEK